MYLSIAIVRAIVDELQRQGVAAAAFCERAGVAPGELSDAALQLPIERSTRVVAAAIELSPSPAIGLHVGARAPIGALHVVGHLIKTPATAREAIQLFLRYSALVFEGGGFFFCEGAERARFTYQHPFSSSRYERFASECALAFFLRMGVQLTGADKRPSRVCFRHETPGWVAEYQRIFGCPVEFSRDANELEFARDLLDLPQPHPDDSLRELLRERADRLLANEHGSDRLGVRIVEIFKLQLPEPDLERLAQSLGLTMRSLQRRLGASGLSLSRLLDEARRQVACASLRTSDAAIKDIAFRVGFSEPSAFHRAFKRWTGMTPAQFRDQRLAR